MRGPSTEIFLQMIELFNRLDVEAALAYYTEDAYYRYGSSPSARGRSEIKERTYSSHLDFVKGMRFDALRTWEEEDVVIAEMEGVRREALVHGAALGHRG